jgi:Fic family protein
MPVISKEMAPQLYRQLEQRNYQAMRFHLRTLVEIGVQNRYFKITPEMVLDLHRAATLYLIHEPGRYRTEGVWIKDSPHEPAPFWDVPRLMNDYFAYLNEQWRNSTPGHLAAYAMWRLYWIHPFEDGNTRISRSMAYLVFCIKYGMWLQGTNTILKQMKRNPLPSKVAIRDANDRYARDKTFDVFLLEKYLEGALIRQLRSV